MLQKGHTHRIQYQIPAIIAHIHTGTNAFIRTHTHLIAYEANIIQMASSQTRVAKQKKFFFLRLFRCIMAAKPALRIV